MPGGSKPSAPNHFDGLEFGSSRPFRFLCPIIVASSRMGRKGFVLPFVRHGPVDLLSLLTGLTHLIHRTIAVNCVVYAFWIVK
jgi:hypothetical protein